MSDVRPWKRAATWLAFLGPFFFATYGFANYVASQRSHVDSIVFAWERSIPFEAWTIVPYWSIDFFYAASVFVCATRSELETHVRRLIAAQVICIACFLAFPLAFTTPRPHPDGALGWMFDALMGFDKPFNQLPSLHIALLVILWTLYVRHVPRALTVVLDAWFLLIAVSILTTYQHHFIDLPTGLWTGWLCIWLFPDKGASPLATARLSMDPRRRVIAAYYALGALATGAISILVGAWGLWLLWAAAALAIVALIYACLDERAFQKASDGSLSAASSWLLAPYLAGAWINSRWWTRGVPRSDEIVPGLALGRMPARDDAAAVQRNVVDLTAELPCPAHPLRYTALPQLDLTIANHAQLVDAVRAIDSSFAEGPTLVCCALGFSRSALAAAAWLVASGRALDAGEAIAMIRRTRPSAVLSPAHVAALEAFTLARPRAARFP